MEGGLGHGGGGGDGPHDTGRSPVSRLLQTFDNLHQIHHVIVCVQDQQGPIQDRSEAVLLDSACRVELWSHGECELQRVEFSWEARYNLSCRDKNRRYRVCAEYAALEQNNLLTRNTNAYHERAVTF